MNEIKNEAILSYLLDGYSLYLRDECAFVPVVESNYFAALHSQERSVA
jgi:hypothetical protein